MDEQQFWKLIDQARAAENPDEALSTSLSQCHLNDIITFKNIWLKYMGKAYTFPLLEANFILCSYISDDMFEDLRAWLIFQGEKRFVDAIKNPETIVDWLDKDRVGDIEEQEFFYIADEVYLSLGGEETVFQESLEYAPAPDMEMEWPETKEKFAQKYPKLVEKFWDQGRVEDMADA